MKIRLDAMYSGIHRADRLSQALAYLPSLYTGTHRPVKKYISGETTKSETPEGKKPPFVFLYQLEEHNMNKNASKNTSINHLSVWSADSFFLEDLVRMRRLYCARTGPMTYICIYP